MAQGGGPTVGPRVHHVAAQQDHHAVEEAEAVGVGEWMVAQMVIPVFISPFTTPITCRGPALTEDQYPDS